MRLSICYTLMQLPGTVLVILVLYFMMDAGWLSELGAALILCVWLLKDIVLYPFFRQAMRKGPIIGSETPVGCSARAGTDVAESRWGRIKNWRASSHDGGECLPHSAAVRVVASSGATLRVEAQPHEIRPERRNRAYLEHSDPDSGPAA
jgi:membrane protein implicated in regulation of membrane protease activity